MAGSEGPLIWLTFPNQTALLSRALKTSFQEIHFQISSNKMHHFVILWITCCLVLHSLIIHIKEGTGTSDIDEWLTPAQGGEGGTGDDGHNDDENNAGNDDGLLHCGQLMDILFYNIS